MLLSLLAALPLLAPQSLEVPPNDGWVSDLAGVLSPQEEQSLERLMESYKSGTGHEIAVLTIESLEGDALEPFSLRVAREWGIGSEESSNGALLVVSKEDRKMRIEVGRGLEGNLTDAISGRIIRDVIAPAFRSQGYYPGILDGVRAMHSAIGGDYGPIERARPRGKGSGGLGRMLINLVFLIGFLFVMGGSGRGRGGLTSMLPWLILGSMSSGRQRSSGFGGGGGGFSGFGGGGGFSGGGASGGW